MQEYKVIKIDLDNLFIVNISNFLLLIHSNSQLRHILKEFDYFIAKPRQNFTHKSNQERRK